jgi:outer membrane protein OmpA-like peptidoglycan-associated protein
LKFEIQQCLGNNRKLINFYQRSILKFLVCLGIFLGFCFYGSAQENPNKRKADEYYQRALKAYFQNDSKKVEENCYNAIDALPTWGKPYYLLGQMYDQKQQYEDAIRVYDKYLVQVPNDFDAIMGKADDELQLEKYDEATADYEHAVSVSDVPPKQHKAAEGKLANMQYIRYLVAHPVPFTPENLGANVNSANDEYFPAFTVDGQTMYFTRKKIGGTKEFHGTTFVDMNEDIMMSKLENNDWQPAEDIPGPINTPDNNEGAMAIAPDGSFMIFTRCVKGNCDLYISFFVNNSWTKPVNMGDPVNTRYNEKQTSISGDGRTIYFSSDRPGGQGGLDLWMSTRDDNWNFSVPVNLGTAINTNQDDQYPFIHPDNQTLYFISRGHKGMGKDDIFYAFRNANGQWDSAINLGYPINTPGYEPGVVIDRLGEYAYFSSERAGGFGGLDLYRFKLPEHARPHPVTYLKAHISDIYSKLPLDAELELVDLETGKSYLKTIASKSGDVEAVLPGGRDYMVNVSDSGYLFYSDNIPLKNYHDNSPFIKNIELSPIKAGEKINLRNVFFPTDGYILEDKSKAELTKLAAFLVANPKVKLEISGHTDNTGKPAYNKDLSEKRAKSVYDYLVNEAKIPSARLTYKGYGDTQPIAPNTSEKGRQQNRRTEVKIIN